MFTMVSGTAVMAADITVDDAVDAALGKAAVLTAIKDAGLQEGQATVSKAGTDFENGKKIFDINFFVAGQTEYDYDIDVVNGTILEKDMDYGDD